MWSFFIASIFSCRSWFALFVISGGRKKRFYSWISGGIMVERSFYWKASSPSSCSLSQWMVKTPTRSVSEALFSNVDRNQGVEWEEMCLLMLTHVSLHMSRAAPGAPEQDTHLLPEGVYFGRCDRLIVARTTKKIGISWWAKSAWERRHQI